MAKEYFDKLDALTSYLESTELFLILNKLNLLGDKEKGEYCKKCGSYKGKSKDIIKPILPANSSELQEVQHKHFHAFFALLLISMYSYDQKLLIPFELNSNQIQMQLTNTLNINDFKNKEVIIDNVNFLTTQMNALDCGTRI